MEGMAQPSSAPTWRTTLRTWLTEQDLENSVRGLLRGFGLLTTAMACLLDNAWKFTSKKTEAWIKVSLLPGKVSGEVVLEVADNGVGFDSVYAGKLFTAFQRLHSSAEFAGNGLGLAIVKRVAQVHGGAVWAQSPGQAGASFFMSLPQAQPDAH